MSKMRVSGKLPRATGNWGSLGMSNGGLGCFCGFTDNISSVYHGLNVSLHSTKKLHKVCPSNFCCFRWIWYDGVHRVWSAGSKIPRTGQFAGIQGWVGSDAKCGSNFIFFPREKNEIQKQESNLKKKTTFPFLYLYFKGLYYIAASECYVNSGFSQSSYFELHSIYIKVQGVTF